MIFLSLFWNFILLDTNNFKLCFKKQQEQNEITINIPAIPISCKTSTIVKNSLNTINIKEIEVNIKNDDEILNNE